MVRLGGLYDPKPGDVEDGKLTAQGRQRARILAATFFLTGGIALAVAIVIVLGWIRWGDSSAFAAGFAGLFQIYLGGYVLYLLRQERATV